MQLDWPGLIVGALIGATSTGAWTFLTIYQRLTRVETRVELLLVSVKLKGA